MKKFLTYFFVTLGVIFFTLLCVLAYLWFADPFNVRPMINLLLADKAPTAVSTETQDGESRNLSPVHETALKTMGISPSGVPNTITPEMEECFVAILGAQRVKEIKNGDMPTATEIVHTRGCYSTN